MKIYTLFALGDEPEAIQSWVKMTTDIVKEIKKIIRSREIGEDEDEESIQDFKDNFICGQDLKYVAKRWKDAQHLSEIIWSDDMDEFWITSSDLVLPPKELAKYLEKNTL